MKDQNYYWGNFSHNHSKEFLTCKTWVELWNGGELQQRVYHPVKLSIWDFLGSLVVKTPCFQCRWVQVPYLVREIRSYMPRGTGQKKFNWAFHSTSYKTKSPKFVWWFGGEWLQYEINVGTNPKVYGPGIWRVFLWLLWSKVVINRCFPMSLLWYNLSNILERWMVSVFHWEINWGSGRLSWLPEGHKGQNQDSNPHLPDPKGKYPPSSTWDDLLFLFPASVSIFLFHGFPHSDWVYWEHELWLT